MDLLQTPFYLLGATLRDNRKRLSELMEEKSLFEDEQIISQARLELTNPRKRLSAEMAWLPGASPRRIKEVIDQLNDSSDGNVEDEDLSGLAKTNVLVSKLVKVSAAEEWYSIVVSILDIAKAYEDVDPEDICLLINEDRIAAGFPEVDSNLVREELIERRRYYCKGIMSVLDKMASADLLDAMTFLVETATDSGENQGPILVDDLVDAYEVAVQEFLEKEAININALIDQIRNKLTEKNQLLVIDDMVSNLIIVLKNWDMVAQPIQVSALSRGLGQDDSEKVAFAIRRLAVDLYNDYDCLELAQRLTSVLQAEFAEVPKIAERTMRDGSDLENIAEKDEKWRKEITFETHIGLIFQNILKISPDGIEWESKIWPLKSITRIRWGGTQHLVNGITTGTTYTILFGTETQYDLLEMKNSKDFSIFIDKLWKAVGYRMLTNFLETLKTGKKYKFGDSWVEDQGIVFEKWHLFSANEQIYCRWGDVTISDGAGCFCISNKNDKGLSVKLSYVDVDNVHILEAAIRELFKHGGDRLSILLGG